MTQSVVNLAEHRSQRRARDYLLKMTRYGVEAASLWLYANTAGRLDRGEFDAALQRERPKFGLP